MLLTTTTGVIPEFEAHHRFRRARELTGLDQNEFAERAGISRQTVSNYENGTRLPRGLYARAWAEASGVDLDWLMTGKARPEGFEPPTYWSVAGPLLSKGCACYTERYHGRGDCPFGCSCGWCAPELWDLDDPYRDLELLELAA